MSPTLRFVRLTALAGAGALLSGCVSLQRHKMLQAESDAAHKDLSAAQEKIAFDQEQNRELTKNLDGAKAQLDQLKVSLSQMTLERDQLQAANANLSHAMESKKGELTSMISTLNAQKLDLEKKVADLSKEKEEESLRREREVAQMKSTYDNLVGEMKQEISDGQVRITQMAGKLSVNVADKIFFDSGRVVLRPAGIQVLQRVGNILKKVTDKQIRIEGHTDNVPIGGNLAQVFPTNWELSTARATNVVRFLQEKIGIDAASLSVAGFGETKPVASNDTEEGRAQNRRIEIVLLDKEAARVLPAAAPSAPAPAATPAASPAPAK